MAEEEKPKVDWAKYGFTEVPGPSFLNKGWYERKDFPFQLYETSNGFLDVVKVYGDNETVDISSSIIPANNQAVVLLLKAFNCPKLP